MESVQVHEQARHHGILGAGTSVRRRLALSVVERSSTEFATEPDIVLLTIRDTVRSGYVPYHELEAVPTMEPLIQ